MEKSFFEIINDEIIDNIGINVKINNVVVKAIIKIEDVNHLVDGVNIYDEVADIIVSNSTNININDPVEINDKIYYVVFIKDNIINKVIKLSSNPIAV